MRATAETRFWAKVQGGDVEECWLWMGTRIPQGYGRFWNGKKLVAAHRWSFEYLHAEIWPSWLHIDHLCGNPHCVNPWHLEPVSRNENSERIHRRLRAGAAPGTVVAQQYRRVGAWSYSRWKPWAVVAHPSGSCRWFDLEAYEACAEDELREHVEMHAAAERLAVEYLAAIP